MRVLHVTSGNLYGGIETMLVTIARHRDAAPGMDSQFAVCFDGRLRDELRETGAAVYNVGPVRARNPLAIRRARAALRQVVRAEAIDVVVCHSAWPHAIFGPAVRAAGLPLVLWQHGPIDGTSWLERWARRSRPELIICNSAYMAEATREFYPGLRMCVLHCPVTMHEESDRLSQAERTAVRDELGAVTDDVVIVQVSRMEEWKGHRLHLEALSQLLDLDGWECWMVGGAQRPSEERYLATLRDLAVRLGLENRVSFLGQRSDVNRILGAADIHCQPNEGPEPFGITFVEALAAGLPVVTTSMGGAVEIVDNTCGVLVDEAATEVLASTLRRLIVDGTYREQLGTGGPARARSLCDPERQIDRLNRLLSPLCRAASLTA